MKSRFSLLAMGLIVMLGMGYESFVTYHGGEISKSAAYLYNFSFAFAVSLWVEQDRRRRAIPAPFEYSAFVFFLWPLAAPHYLYRSRGGKGAFLGLGLVLLSLFPYIAAWATYLAF